MGGANHKRDFPHISSYIRTYSNIHDMIMSSHLRQRSENMKSYLFLLLLGLSLSLVTCADKNERPIIGN